MSDSKPNQNSSPDTAPEKDVPSSADSGRSAVAPEAHDDAHSSGDDEHVAGEDDEFGDDELDELDRLGVDGVVAALDDGAGQSPRSRRGRSPFISIVVLIACLYPLFSMFGDFRYWLGASEPTDLGHATAFMAGGSVPPGHANTYVKLEGTPDVQWATVLTTKKRGKINYLRIREGGGQLFASVPRSDEEDDLVTPTYAGEFVGRMSRLGDDRAFEWLQQLFAQEKVSRVVDSTPEQLSAALATAGETIEIGTTSGPLQVKPDDLVRFVVKPPEARVLLGIESFTRAEADAAVGALGVPFVRLADRSADFHSYVARISASELEGAQKQLRAAIEGEVDPTDHKEGASVFPMQATYFAPIGDVVFTSAGEFEFPYGSNTTTPGYDVVNGSLAERSLGGQPLRVPAAQLAAVRLEQPIELDPDGYIVEVGVDPASQRIWGIMWLVVLGVCLTNVGALYLTLRPRAA